MPLQLHLLATLDVVATNGGITRAAEQLGLSQPSVSRQLQQLERSAKAKLFEPVGRRVRLTQQGEVLAGYARHMAVLAAQAEQALEEMSHLRSGRLAFGAGTSLSVHLLPAALVRFRQRFPDITLRLEAGRSEQLRDWLARDEIDFALIEVLLPSPEFDATVFSMEELVAIVPARHRLASRKSLALGDLASECFLARETESQTGTLVERVFRQQKLNIKPAMSFGSTEVVKHAVAAGLGVSIVPRMSIGLDVAAKTLVAIKLKDVALRRPIYLARRSGTKAGKPEIAFLCILKHVIRGTLPKFRNTR